MADHDAVARSGRRTCIAPAAVLAVVLLMIVPLPPLLLDLLLSVDIGLAVVLLLTAIYVKQPVEFSRLPVAAAAADADPAVAERRRRRGSSCCTAPTASTRPAT